MSTIDFEKICKQHGDKIAKQNGTKCEWVDPFATKKDIIKSKFSDRKLTLKSLDTNYTSGVPTPFITTNFPAWFDNDLSSEGTMEFEDSYTIKTALEYSYEQKMKWGIKTKVELTVVSTEMSYEIELNNKWTNLTEEEHTRTVKTKIPVPPRTSVAANIIVDYSKFDVDIMTNILITGVVPTWFKKKTNLGGGQTFARLWFFDIKSVIRDSPADTKNFSVTPKGVIFHAKGKLRGQLGLGYHIQTKEFPLRKVHIRQSNSIPRKKPLNMRTIPDKKMVKAARNY